MEEMLILRRGMFGFIFWKVKKRRSQWRRRITLFFFFLFYYILKTNKLEGVNVGRQQMIKWHVARSRRGHSCFFLGRVCVYVRWYSARRASLLFAINLILIYASSLFPHSWAVPSSFFSPRFFFYKINTTLSYILFILFKKNGNDQLFVSYYLG